MQLFQRTQWLILTCPIFLYPDYISFKLLNSHCCQLLNISQETLGWLFVFPWELWLLYWMLKPCLSLTWQIHIGLFLSLWHWLSRNPFLWADRHVVGEQTLAFKSAFELEESGLLGPVYICACFRAQLRDLF